MAVKKCMNSNGELVPMNVVQKKETPKLKEMLPEATEEAKAVLETLDEDIRPITELSMKELKALAKESGLEFKGNISKKALIQLIDCEDL